VDHDELTPLHLALRRGHLDLARLLVEYGADVRGQTKDESTSYMTSSGGHVDLTHALADRSTDTDTKTVCRYSLPLYILYQVQDVAEYKGILDPRAEHGKS